jgi:hypothetical protein
VASFGQDLRVFKWNYWGNQAADFIAGSVAKHASSGCLIGQPGMRPILVIPVQEIAD